MQFCINIHKEQNLASTAAENLRTGTGILPQVRSYSQME